MARVRRHFHWAMLVSLLWFASPVHAHAALKSSLPAEGSAGPAPSQLMLEFSHPVRLTSLVITGDRGPVAVMALPKSSAARVELPAPRLAPGDYELAWRAVGSDGHVMSGHVRFKVQADTAR
jgi:methionine-rich copper-binding protein CopC